LKYDLPPGMELRSRGDSLIGTVAEPMPLIMKLTALLADPSRRQIDLTAQV
jgi:hypothetical protein